MGDDGGDGFLGVVLAAGEGSRMRSALPKVLHRVAGRTMLAAVMGSLREAGATSLAVVTGPGREDVAAEARAAGPEASLAVQAERLGTAHAVLAARGAIQASGADLIVAYADTPLLEPATLRRLRDALTPGVAVVALGFEAAEPRGYGRFVTRGTELLAIREEKDAGEDERAIQLCNAGMMALAGAHALAILDRIGDANAAGEFYLTDAVAVARELGLGTAYLVAAEAEVQGVNDRAQLARAEATAQHRLRARAMAGGVTLRDPGSIFLSDDSRFGRDVTIEPHVVIGPGVSLADGVTVLAFSHLEGAEVGEGVAVGPFARLRPGTRLRAGARVGNFVEVKNAEIGAGAKLPHLAYVGDATVGAGANLGAGTITCNYDGHAKHRTMVGEGAFVGSNSSLVAPVTIGRGAYVGSGSVIVEDVPDDALAIGRGRQVVKQGWAAELRTGRATAAKNTRT